METLKVKSKNFKEILNQALKAIKKGEIIICPTDTVYGLLSKATDKKAVKKLFKIKKRPKEKAVPIFVKDIKMAKKFSFINKKQEKFLRMVWPGKVTVVLKRKNVLPSILFAKKETIGLRIPDYKLVKELLKKSNLPLTSTSANISGGKPSTKIKEVINQFEKEKIKPDLVLDAGNLRFSLPSIVLDLTGKTIKVLRT